MFVKDHHIHRHVRRRVSSRLLLLVLRGTRWLQMGTTMYPSAWLSRVEWCASAVLVQVCELQIGDAELGANGLYEEVRLRTVMFDGLQQHDSGM